MLPAPPTLLERLLHLTALVALAAALALVAVRPSLAIFGWGDPLLPGAVHLVTLGGVLSLAYLLLGRLWRQLYGGGAAWAPLGWAAWAFHASGVALLAWGFLHHDPTLAYWGGHYLVPTGVLLALAHGWVAAWRRPRGAPRRLAAHLPGLGLAVTVSLGALLVMDAYTARYGIYTPATILAHALAAGFLFVLPLLLLPDALAQAPPPAPAGHRETAGAAGPAVAALARWYAAVAVGASGVLLVVLALADAGAERLLAIGLALLGALLVWLGLPPGQRLGGGLAALRGVALLPLAGRLATGVFGVYAALRYARGAEPGEAFWLGKVGALLFLLAVALPELLALLERAHGVHGARGRLAVWLAGTALLLAGQLWVEPWAVRAGALVWLAGLGWHALAVWERR
jgi:hypothetical protein